jgi:hypothetical protein
MKIDRLIPLKKKDIESSSANTIQNIKKTKIEHIKLVRRYIFRSLIPFLYLFQKYKEVTSKNPVIKIDNIINNIKVIFQGVLLLYNSI